eukprot:3119879-Lingulodinium_polyedra.AAC.1
MDATVFCASHDTFARAMSARHEHIARRYRGGVAMQRASNRQTPSPLSAPFFHRGSCGADPRRGVGASL